MWDTISFSGYYDKIHPQICTCVLKGDTYLSIRFIGNKQRLLPFILHKVTSTVGSTPGTFADLFTGTASVARAFKGIGYRVIANDLLKSSEVFATTALRLSHPPLFRQLQNELLQPRTDFLIEGDLYDRVLYHLNALQGIQGFFYREYAPTASTAKGTPRQYFTDANASKIDAIRLTIRHWWERELITETEKLLLLSGLMLAANSVANVAGTYGYFLRDWYDKALEPLQMVRIPITPGREDHVYYREDANKLAREYMLFILTHHIQSVNIVRIITFWKQ